MSYMEDPDIQALVRDEVFQLPDGQPQLEAFMKEYAFSQNLYAQGQTPPESALRATAQSAMTAYQESGGALAIGWQKLLLLEAGLAGIDLDSYEVMKWVHEKCAEHGWDIGDDGVIAELISQMAVPYARLAIARRS